MQHLFQDKTIRSITWVHELWSSSPSSSASSLLAKQQQQVMSNYFGFASCRPYDIIYDDDYCDGCDGSPTSKTTGDCAGPRMVMHTQIIGRQTNPNNNDDGTGGGPFTAMSTTRCDASLFLETLRRTRAGDIVIFSGRSRLLPRRLSSSLSSESTAGTEGSFSFSSANHHKHHDDGYSIDEAVEKYSDVALLFGSGGGTGGSNHSSNNSNNNNNNNSNSSKEEAVVTGKQLVEVMQQNDAAGGAGVLYLDIPHAVFGAYHQFLCGGTPAEKFRNTIATFISAATQESFLQIKKDVDHIWTQTMSIVAAAAASSSSSSSSVSCDFYRQCARKLIRTKNDLERSQFPCRIVPLALCGGGGNSSSSNNGGSSSSSSSLNDSRHLLADLAERLFGNIAGLQSFHRLICTDALTSTLGAVCWTRRMALVPIHSRVHEHQHLLFDLLSSPQWIENVCKIEPMETFDDAAAYIESRPAKMYRGGIDDKKKGGLGSFAIVVLDHDNKYQRRAAYGKKVAPTFLAGIAGLISRSELAPDLDLGFALLPEWQGNGLAKEAASLVMFWAERLLCLDKVKAVARRSNVASTALLAKLGFVPECTRELWGSEQVIFSRKLNAGY